MQALARREIRPHRVPRRVHDAGVLDRRRHADRLVDLAVHAVLEQRAQHAPQRLAGARLGDDGRRGRRRADQATQRGDGPDLRAHARLDLGEQLGVVERAGRRRHHKGKGQLALELVGNADDRRFRDLRVRGDGLLERAGGEAVRGYVDDVVLGGGVSAVCHRGGSGGGNSPDLAMMWT